MNKYGWYIFSAYSGVIIFLLIQWLLPWCRWRRYLKNKAESPIHE